MLVVAQGKLSILRILVRDQGPFQVWFDIFLWFKIRHFKYDELHIGLHGFRACSAKTWSISCGLKFVRKPCKRSAFSFRSNHL